MYEFQCNSCDSNYIGYTSRHLHLRIEEHKYSVIGKHLAPVVQRLDSAIHRINHYPADSVVCFVDTYPLDSDLSGGLRYAAFEQLGPEG